MMTGKARIRHTRKAIFLSLFIAENCFRRDNTAESRGLSGATLSSTIHGLPDSTNNHCYVLNKINSFSKGRTYLHSYYMEVQN